MLAGVLRLLVAASPSIAVHRCRPVANVSVVFVSVVIKIVFVAAQPDAVLLTPGEPGVLGLAGHQLDQRSTLRTAGYASGGRFSPSRSALEIAESV